MVLLLIHNDYDSSYSRMQSSSSGDSFYIKQLQYIFIEILKIAHNRSPVFLNESNINEYVVYDRREDTILEIYPDAI